MDQTCLFKWVTSLLLWLFEPLATPGRTSFPYGTLTLRGAIASPFPYTNLLYRVCRPAEPGAVILQAAF